MDWFDTIVYCTRTDNADKIWELVEQQKKTGCGVFGQYLEIVFRCEQVFTSNPLSPLQADSINPFRILWIVDCETIRGDWILKISGVTEKITPGVSQNRPEDFDKHTKFCGRCNTSKNDM